jgi:hypothetical protein
LMKWFRSQKITPPGSKTIAGRRFRLKLGHSNPQHQIKSNVCAKEPKSFGSSCPLSPGSSPRSSDPIESASVTLRLPKHSHPCSWQAHGVPRSVHYWTDISIFSRFYRRARWVPTTASGNLKKEYFMASAHGFALGPFLLWADHSNIQQAGLWIPEVTSWGSILRGIDWFCARSGSMQHALLLPIP